MVYKPGINIEATESIPPEVLQKYALVDASNTGSFSIPSMEEVDSTSFSADALPSLPVEKIGKHEAPTVEFSDPWEMHRVAKVAQRLGHPALAEQLTAKAHDFVDPETRDESLIVVADMALQAFDVARHAVGVHRYMYDEEGELREVQEASEQVDAIDPDMPEAMAILRCYSAATLGEYACAA